MKYNALKESIDKFNIKIDKCISAMKRLTRERTILRSRNRILQHTTTSAAQLAEKVEQPNVPSTLVTTSPSALIINAEGIRIQYEQQMREHRRNKELLQNDQSITNTNTLITMGDLNINARKEAENVPASVSPLIGTGFSMTLLNQRPSQSHTSPQTFLCGAHHHPLPNLPTHLHL